jgi:putative transposase
MFSEDSSPENDKWRNEIERLNRECFIKFEDIMHRHLIGPTWLLDDRIADNVAGNLHRLDGDAYRSDALSIMSNHVHTVFKPLVDAALIEQILKTDVCADVPIPALAKIMQAIKGRSARECNLILGRSGQFWEHESFDHVIRIGRFDKTVRYVLNNPVKAGLVQTVARISVELLQG